MKKEYIKAKRICIAISLEEFEQILDKIVYGTNESENSLTYCEMKEDFDVEESMYPALEEYFEIKKIISIHADDNDYPTIWIEYKE